MKIRTISLLLAVALTCTSCATKRWGYGYTIEHVETLSGEYTVRMLRANREIKCHIVHDGDPSGRQMGSLSIYINEEGVVEIKSDVRRNGGGGSRDDEVSVSSDGTYLLANRSERMGNTSILLFDTVGDGFPDKRWTWPCGGDMTSQSITYSFEDSEENQGIEPEGPPDR